jgi:flagellar biosynthesis/type III secretory pathway M-ring protein FliF/YscJ
MALRSLRAPAEAAAEAAGEQVATLAPDTAAATAGEMPRSIPERALPASAHMRERIVATVEEQPEVAARLLKAWMKE